MTDVTEHALKVIEDFDKFWDKFYDKNYDQVMDLKDDYEDCIDDWKVKQLCFRFYLLGREDCLNYVMDIQQDDSI
jgi:hypothetical protein